MPIIIKHEPPVGVLANLAIQAGSAEGRQARIARGSALMSQLLAMQERGADIAAQRAAQEQAFAFQSAMAERATKTQKRLPDQFETRQRLGRAITEAEESGIYTPQQIKQMKIFATMGNEGAIKEILGAVPREPLERERQLTELQTMAEQDTQKIQVRATDVERRLAQRLGPINYEATPELAPQDVKEMWAERDALRTAQTQLQQRYQQLQVGVRLGVPVSEQLRAQRQEEQFETRQTAQVPWMERQRVQAAVRTKQSEINALIRQLTGSQAALLDPDEVTKIQNRIEQLQTETNQLFEVPQGERRKATDAEKAQAVIQSNGDLTEARRILKDTGLEE